MIATLKGSVAAKFRDWAVVECGGVGYQVYLGSATLRKLSSGQQVSLWTHEYVREDRRDLFGFVSVEEYRLFLQLIGVSGVGPKTALAMLAIGDAAEIERRIERGDVAWLAGTPGVGKKTAQKIVLELRGKLAEVDAGADDEVISALVNLGYARERVLEAVAQGAPASDAPLEERLRGALRMLGR